MNIVNKNVILILTLLYLNACSDKEVVNKKNYNKLLPTSRADLMQIDTALVAMKAKEFVIAGSTLQIQNKHAEAILEFQQALRYDSSSAILYSIAKSYFALNKNDLSAENLLKSIELDSDFLPSLELLSQIYVSRYDYQKAAEIIEKIIVKENTLSRRQYLAKIYEFSNPQKAMKVYEGIIADYQNLSAIRNLAGLYKIYKSKEEYIKLLEKLQEVNPTNVQNALEVIEYYTKEGEYSNSIHFLSKLDSILPSSEIYQCYGIVGNRLYDDSSQNAKNNILPFINKIDSRFYFDWRIQMLSAYLAMKINDTNKIDYHFNQVLKVVDSIPDIPLQIANYYSVNKKDSIALKILVNNRQKFPLDKRYPFFIGLTYLNSDNNNEAITYFKQAIQMDTAYVDALTHLGLIYDRLKNADSSDIYYLKALNIDPNNILANNNYAYSLSERGDKLTEALERSKVALEASPSNSSYLDTYAWINYKLGNFEIALKFINKAIATGDVNAELFEHLGDILSKMQKESEAQNAFKQSLTLEPNRKSVLEKIKR